MAKLGRPFSRKKRCYCGANTFNRAKLRAFQCCKVAGKAPPEVLARMRKNT